MGEYVGFLIRHQFLAGAALSSAATWVFNNILTVLVTNLPSPTKSSSAKYRYWFRVLNTWVGNIARANSNAVESSPNWQDAVTAYVRNGKH